MSKIVIIAKGSYGDIIPLFAIAHELKQRGHTPSFVTYRMHHLAFSSRDYPVAWLDQTDSDSSKGEKNGLLWNIQEQFVTAVFSSLKAASPSPSEVRREINVVRAAAKDADVIVGTQLAFAGPIVAKELGIRWVFCAMSPLAIPSYADPSLFPYLHWLQRLSIDSPNSQRTYYAIARSASRLLQHSIVAQQRSHGISNTPHPLFEGMYSADLNLVLMSPTLIDHAPDWPAATLLTGFTWFEPKFFGNPEALARVDAFLDAGDPPVVFALGAGAGGRTNPSQFFHQSIKACERLGLRAIVVAYDKFHHNLPNSNAVLTTGYLPYSMLFQRAQAVVHSGGIGTIGWGLRYGVPTLLRPSSVDQFDNAYRAAKKGLVDVLPRNQYKTPMIAKSLENLLNNSKRRSALEQVAQTVAAENGAKIACEAIARLVD